MTEETATQGFQALLNQATELRKRAKFNNRFAIFETLFVGFLLSGGNWVSALGVLFLAGYSLEVAKSLSKEADRLESLPVRWGQGEHLESLVYEGVLGGPLPRRRHNITEEEEEELGEDYIRTLLTKRSLEGSADLSKGSLLKVLGWLWLFTGIVIGLSFGPVREMTVNGWAVTTVTVAASLVLYGSYRLRRPLLFKRAEMLTDKLILLEVADDEESIQSARQEANHAIEFVQDRKNYFTSYPK